MRYAIIFFALLLGPAAHASTLVTTCGEQTAVAEHNLVRVSPSQARTMLRKRTEIAVAAATLNKLGSGPFTLEVDVSARGAVECFNLLTAEPQRKLDDDDQVDLRGAVASALQQWEFAPFGIEGRGVDVRASYRLRVEPRKLVVDFGPGFTPRAPR